MRVNLLGLIFCLLLSSCICRAELQGSVDCSVKEAWVYQQEKFSVHHGALFSNAVKNNHVIFTVTKPGAYNLPDPYFKIALRTGKFGFGELINFFNMTVNGIPLHKIMISAEKFVPWKEKDRAGVQIPLNFDGAKVILKFYMIPGSPLLFGTLVPDSSTIEPLQTAVLKISAIPSTYIMKDRKVQWQSADYRREAVAPARTFKQSNQAQLLTAEDSSLIFQDELLNGENPEKGNGPCALFLNFSGIEKGILNMGSNWSCNCQITLKKDFKEFQFAVWQPSQRISNKEFASKFQQLKKSFVRR